MQITQVPTGEAPLWVRQKWVGLALPLAQGSADPVRRRGAGVLTGPKSRLAMLAALLTGKVPVHEGYIVEVGAAISVLEANRPEAATWWKQNAAHMLRPGKKFIFDSSCGYVI